MASDMFGVTQTLGSRLDVGTKAISATAFKLADAIRDREIDVLLRPDRLTPPNLRPILPFIPPQPVFQPPPALPAAPGANTFAELPFPSPGDRIKADDIKKISQSLRIIYEMSVLSASLMGHTYKEVRLALGTQQYEVRRVMSVFGTELDNPADTSLDNRKVIQVIPLELGTHNVGVILSENVDTRPFAPRLDRGSHTYKSAVDNMKALLKDVAFTGPPKTAPQMAGTLEEAIRRVSF